MCGRFTRSKESGDYKALFGIDLPPLKPSFNVAPTQSILAVREHDGEREGVLLRWGLIPSWAKDAKSASWINARADTVASKPAFRSAFKKRRCLVIADGYYEWNAEGKQKQPYYFRLKGGQPFAFAGLWERWEGGDDPLETCALITTDANELSRTVHDRMPVILSREACDLWLDAEVEDAGTLQQLLRPYPAEEMETYPVSTLVNSPRNHGPELVERPAS